jgi:acyl-CoA reductase-like NAD-dependent aldehyde dehydrogenase
MPGSGGYFVEPTVFDGVDNSMKIAREEIFGPVISTIVFDSEDEGLAIANATNYGLHAAVYTNDLDTAVRAARTLRAGTVSVNAYSEGDITTPSVASRNRASATATRASRRSTSTPRRRRSGSRSSPEGRRAGSLTLDPSYGWWSGGHVPIT